MMKLLRRHKDWLMIVIAILAIPFIFYFVRTPDYGAMKQGDVGPHPIESPLVVHRAVIAQRESSLAVFSLQCDGVRRHQ